MTYADDEATRELAAAFGRDMGKVLPNVRKNNMDATRAPLPSDDETQGYAVGSRWGINGAEWLRADAEWVPATGHLTPAHFGAVGDGVTDDTVALQAMLNAVQQNGGEAVIPNRTFVVSATLTLPKLGAGGKRVMLRGEGHQSELRFTMASGICIYAGNPVSQGGALGWHLRDFKIKGTSALTGVYLERANSARVEGVSFDTLGEAIAMSETYGARILNNHAVGLTGDFLRCVTRTFGTVVSLNGVFNIGGYLLNLTGAVPSLNIVLEGNDTEVCGGIIKSAGLIHALTYRGNYMEQASGPIFDFAAAVNGQIEGNTFQLSPENTIANYLGTFVNNHLVEQRIVWAATSFPIAVAGNVVGANSAVPATPAKVPTLAPAYMAHPANYLSPRYRRDVTGRVHMSGNATRDTGQAAPTLPYTLFTLEAGYRPAATQTFATQGASPGVSKIRIAASGDVVLEGGGLPDFGLGGISFMAGA